MKLDTILTIIRLVLPVLTQVVSIFHGSVQAKNAAQAGVDTAPTP